MLRAAIDIGSNTVLLLVAEQEGEQLEPLHEEQRVPRLGRDVDRDGRLGEDGMERVLKALKEYHELLDRDYPDCATPVVTATSAVRDAANRDAFLQRIRRETGWEVKLLSGTDEARCTYRGAASTLKHMEENESVLVLDIGGGSTEIAAGSGLELVDSHSYDMGCVRFTERYLKHDPPYREEVSQCRKAIRGMLGERKIDAGNEPVAIGVAGTLTSLASIEQGLRDYQPEKLNGYILRREVVEERIDDFSHATHNELLERYPKILGGRADIILAGLLILHTFMDYFGLEGIRVSTGGIRHGALLTFEQGEKK